MDSLNDDPTAPTRASLLDRLQSLDDHASWQEFFDTYWKLIYSVALKAGLSETDARDVVQETVISLTRQIPRFRYDPVKGSFKSWLYQQTQWRVLDHLRKQRQKALREKELDETDLGTPWIERIPDRETAITERLWDDEWERNLMDLALERLRKSISPKQYQLFDLHVIREWPVQKVVEALKVTRAQVYLAKQRVCAKLTDEVRRIRAELEATGNQDN